MLYLGAVCNGVFSCRQCS